MIEPVAGTQSMMATETRAIHQTHPHQMNQEEVSLPK